VDAVATIESTGGTAVVHDGVDAGALLHRGDWRCCPGSLALLLLVTGPCYVGWPALLLWSPDLAASAGWRCYFGRRTLLRWLAGVATLVADVASLVAGICSLIRLKRIYNF
jgi:hypothetical protein